MTKIITIDSNKYELPEGMGTKDIQALAGFLITLTRVEYEYCYGQGENVYYSAEGAQVSIGNLETMPRAEAKAKADAARAAYDAKKKAEA